MPAGVSARPALDGRHLYLALRDGTVSAYALETGAVVWTTRSPVVVPPLATGGLVLAIGADLVEALSADDGTVRWRTPLASPPSAAGALVNGRLVLGLQSADVVNLDPATGTVLWRTNLGAPLSAPPAGDERRLLCGLVDGRVVAVSPDTGQLEWSQKTGDAIAGLALESDRVYAGSRDNYFYSLVSGSGRLDWKWRTGGDIVGEPAFDRDRVYFASLDNLLRALDRKHGAQQWKRSLRSRPLGGPAVVGEAVMVAGFAAEIRTHWVSDGRAVDRIATDAELAAPLVVLPRAWPRVGGLAVVTSAGQLLLLVERIDPEVLPFKAPVGEELALTAPPELP